MRALVFGLGRSGKAAKALLERGGAAVTALDGEAAFPEGKFDLAIVSPGIAQSHPWIVEAQRRGVPIKSELQFGCEELKRQGWKLLAVTGSKGKSSVVKIVADAITLSGQHAVACGNYGVPVCEVALGSRLADRGSSLVVSEPRTTSHELRIMRWAVVEVSSFMMETTELPADTFEAAAILNLQEDHLDRHGSVEVYHALKRKLLRFAKAKFEKFEGFETFERLGTGSYFDNDILRSNGAIAAALMRVAGLDAVTIARAFREFEPLPHRMAEVGVFDGVRYVDDSKATSVAALVAGVTMAGCSVRLIAGGLAKGDDPKEALPRLTERVEKVYLIGDCAEKFAKAWEESVDCEICGTLERAVAAAMREAAKGETVLLSPGTASFDQFKSFGERGEVFARLVKKERQNK